MKRRVRFGLLTMLFDVIAKGPVVEMGRYPEWRCRSCASFYDVYVIDGDGTCSGCLNMLHEAAIRYTLRLW